MIELKTWRLIDTKIGSAYWNMAVDEALLEGFKEGDLPILRLYGWENALSVGKFLNISKSVNMKKLEHQKLPLVRRMSGGGVLVHGDDLSYTLIVPREALKDRGVKESYHNLCGFLIRLYEKLGHTADFVRDSQFKEVKSDICLAGNETYDIVIEGGKMGGNAQRHTRHALFQHGTIPMRLNEALFNPLFTEESGLKRAATLERLGTSIEYEPLSLLVREAFCETFGVELLSEPLRIPEEERAKKLLMNKYTQERWNYDGKIIYP
ncbi:MAG: lipoate--protein ligase family protein [Sulfuricurvum sp.]|nr:lipoate--protein ligase family protein [Sulfuricurvum sp.]